MDLRLGQGLKSADDQNTGHWLRASRNKSRVFGVLVARVTLYSLQLRFYDVNRRAPLELQTESQDTVREM